MLLDANLLIYAVDSASPFHERTKRWMTDRLNGASRVGIPWQSLSAFLRIVTHPRASDNPLTSDAAWSYVTDWLDVDIVWTPEPGRGFGALLGGLLARHQVGGNLVPDAMLAALAIEHGLTIYSADSDFARFDQARWINPLAGDD